MAGSNAEARVYREIVRLAHSGIDSPTLRLEVMHRLRKVIPVDAFLGGDGRSGDPVVYERRQGGDPRQAVPRFVENEFLEDDFNKFRVLAASSRAPVGSLYRATKDRPDTSRRYREILTPLGFSDELRAAFRAGGSVWGFACVHRERGIVATRLRMRDCLPRWRRILPKACVPHCCSSIHAVATRRTMRRARD